ncbi:glycosyltransferase family 2 protein [Streptosporangium sp. 'caverna']|uniref:glycosyltransferase family 2 protein n=1 Tax=Streptosporangium sp. 'caverna' TaxID=2202249 RepID=UPI000D7DE30C|nr:glycosyltransferase family 2 protein [Streptosporangium sp. 'caverna']AWS40148.1 glycosyltransferase family 2 protein [Streptosporangium sp. 'caverna']
MLVSIGLPVYNGADVMEGVVRSVLAQQYGDVELVISDNASTDSTEELCRGLAAQDSRISYHRQPENLGMLRNFDYAIQVAKGDVFRWIGDDDRLDPTYATKCVDAFTADPRLLMVTTQISYTDTRDGVVRTQRYEEANPGFGLGSDDPAERVTELLRLLNESYLIIDPLYGMVRREPVAAMTRRNMPREDQVFATRLAMAGPWEHINEVLAERHWDIKHRGKLARRLGVPTWKGYCSTLLQCRETLFWAHAQVEDGTLTAEQYRRIRSAVRALYVRRHRQTAVRRVRKVTRMAVGRS